METLTISLPATLMAFSEAQGAEGNDNTANDYICALIREAQKRHAKEKVDAVLLEGLQAEASDMTPEDWDELKRQVWERHGQQDSPAPAGRFS